MDSEHSVSGAGRSPREGGEHIPREGGEQILHIVSDGFCCERHSERVRAGGDATGLSADIIDSILSNRFRKGCVNVPFTKKER
jgi:hypothetical protein